MNQNVLFILSLLVCFYANVNCVHLKKQDIPPVEQLQFAHLTKVTKSYADFVDELAEDLKDEKFRNYLRAKFNSNNDADVAPMALNIPYEEDLGLPEKDKKKWMDKGKVLRFIVTGTEINFQVRITDFKYSEQDGTRDVYFTINLKEYRKIKISSTTPKKKKTDNKDRTDTKETDNKPKQKTYTVKSGDTLYDIAKKHYGKGSDYKKIIEKNKSKYPSLAKSTTLKKGWVLTI